MPLHPPTLLFVTALVATLSGGLLLLARGPRRDLGPIGLWGAAMLLGALGLVLDAPGLDGPWLGEGLGTAAILGATAASWMAARTFAERPQLVLLAVVGPLAWLLLLPMHGASGPWLALACWVGGAYILAAAWELWRVRTERLPSAPTALVLLASHGAVYVARGADVLAGRDTGPWTGAIQAALLIEGLLNTVGMAVMLLCLMKERVELRTSGQLRAQALQDGLTGIANRRHFDERLATELRRACRNRLPVALLMVDVDSFKLFNDAFGHPEGDDCLRLIAATLSRLVRHPANLVARYGGEEFAILLPGTGLPGASEVAEALRAAVTALRMPHRTRAGVVTISVGAAVMLPDLAGDPVALVQAADRALYRAKADGRNCVRVAGMVALTA